MKFGARFVTVMSEHVIDPSRRVSTRRSAARLGIRTTRNGESLASGVRNKSFLLIVVTFDLSFWSVGLVCMHVGRGARRQRARPQTRPLLWFSLLEEFLMKFKRVFKLCTNEEKNPLECHASKDASEQVSQVRENLPKNSAHDRLLLCQHGGLKATARSEDG